MFESTGSILKRWQFVISKRKKSRVVDIRQNEHGLTSNIIPHKLKFFNERDVKQNTCVGGVVFVELIHGVEYEFVVVSVVRDQIQVIIRLSLPEGTFVF